MERHIFEHLQCPRDRISLRAVFPTIQICTEGCVTDDHNAYLALMRQHIWTRMTLFGIPRDLAYWGQALRHLDIRSVDRLRLNVLEFLPEIETVHVSCLELEDGVGWVSSSLRAVHIITPLSVTIRAEIGSSSRLEILEIEAGEVKTIGTPAFPSSLTRLELNGTVRDSVLEMLPSSNLKTIRIARGLLCEVPPLPPTVEDLDVSSNFLSTWETHPMTVSHPTRLVRVSLAGNIALDIDSIDPAWSYDAYQTFRHVNSLDLRGVGDEYIPNIDTLRELIITNDPPADIAIRFPQLRRVIVCSFEYHPLPGSQIERLACTHPADDDQRVRDAIVTMTGYIDDVEISYMAVPDDDDESDASVSSSP